MNVAVRSGTVGLMLISGLLFCVIATIAIGYVQRQGFEIGVVVPLAPPAVTVLLSFVVIRVSLEGVLRSVVSGLTFGCTLYLAVPIFFLSTNYDLIRGDGTAYWGLLLVPAVWLWPAVIVGSATVATGKHYLLTPVVNRRSGDD